MSWSNGTPTPGNDIFTGTAFGDSPAGAEGGSDTMHGAGGDDSLLGDDGNDVLHGGSGSDTIEGGAGTDFILGDDAIDPDNPDAPPETTGNLLTDSMDGAVITGGGGDDTILTTLAGAWDAAAPWPGMLLQGGAGHDLIAVTGSATGFAPVLAGDAGDDTLLGSATHDTLLGGDDNDSIEGGGGNDLIEGGGGNDTILGGGGTDSLAGGAGYDLLVADHRGSTGDLTFIAGDNVSFDGTEATGFEQFRIHSGSGHDSLRGGDGDDTLDGGLGTDSFEGGLGTDLIEGGDVVIRNEDGSFAGVERVSDLVTYENAAAPISFSLNDGSELVHVGETELDELVNIEQVIGTGYADTMEMSWGHETVDVLMEGRGGDDIINLVGQTAATLDGGEGHDTISGGSADDTILGGQGNDLVFGGAGGDSILGGAGANTIEGGTGGDSILSGEENDLVIWRLGDGNDTIDLGGGQDTLHLEGWNGADTANDAWELSVDGTTATFTGNEDVGGAVITVVNYDPADTVVCFAEGTRIMTARGEVPVEALWIGDLVLTAGNMASFKPILWLGHARIDLTRHRARDRVAPVLITAGALGAGVPHRDLRVSPEHALLIDGTLVPAGLLVNGTTIRLETWRSSVTYWHVELEGHDVLVAEGALAESYLEDGNRHFFGGTAVVALDPDFGAGRAARGYAQRACAPVAAEGDAVLTRIRLRLAAKAQSRVA